MGCTASSPNEPRGVDWYHFFAQVIAEQGEVPDDYRAVFDKRDPSDLEPRDKGLPLLALALNREHWFRFLIQRCGDPAKVKWKERGIDTTLRERLVGRIKTPAGKAAYDLYLQSVQRHSSANPTDPVERPNEADHSFRRAMGRIPRRPNEPTPKGVDWYHFFARVITAEKGEVPGDYQAIFDKRDRSHFEPKDKEDLPLLALALNRKKWFRFLLQRCGDPAKVKWKEGRDEKTLGECLVRRKNTPAGKEAFGLYVRALQQQSSANPTDPVERPNDEDDATFQWWSKYQAEVELLGIGGITVAGVVEGGSIGATFPTSIPLAALDDAIWEAIRQWNKCFNASRSTQELRELFDRSAKLLGSILTELNSRIKDAEKVAKDNPEERQRSEEQESEVDTLEFLLTPQEALGVDCTTAGNISVGAKRKKMLKMYNRLYGLGRLLGIEGNADDSTFDDRSQRSDVNASAGVTPSGETPGEANALGCLLHQILLWSASFKRRFRSSLTVAMDNSTALKAAYLLFRQGNGILSFSDFVGNIARNLDSALSTLHNGQRQVACRVLCLSIGKINLASTEGASNPALIRSDRIVLNIHQKVANLAPADMEKFSVEALGETFKAAKYMDGSGVRVPFPGMFACDSTLYFTMVLHPIVMEILEMGREHMECSLKGVRARAGDDDGASSDGGDPAGWSAVTALKDFFEGFEESPADIATADEYRRFLQRCVAWDYDFALRARGKEPPAYEMNTAEDAERWLRPHLFGADASGDSSSGSDSNADISNGSGSGGSGGGNGGGDSDGGGGSGGGSGNHDDDDGGGGDGESDYDSAREDTHEVLVPGVDGSVEDDTSLHDHNRRAAATAGTEVETSLSPSPSGGSSDKPPSVVSDDA